MTIREAVRAAFKRYDADGSGSINVRELQALVADLGGVLSDAQVAQVAKLLDKDGNGDVSEAEFLRWWSSESADLDGDGVVTDVELALRRLRDVGATRFYTDIHVAVWHAQVDVVQRLLDENAELVNDKDASDYGNLNSPLHYAAYQGHTSLCELLLARGASLNAVNASGCTPLFLACQQDRVGVVDLLLARGADVKMVEKEHQYSPIDVCTSPEILERFKKMPGQRPNTPAPPSLHQVSSTALRVEWSLPKSGINETTPIVSSSVQLAVQGGGTLTPVVVTAPATTITIDGLQPGVTYSATVAVSSLHGISSYSKPSDAVATRQERPAPPPNIRIARKTARSIVLAWDAPDNQPASVCVQQCVGGSDWKLVCKLSADALETTIDGLCPDFRYTFRVATITDCGHGDFSTAISAKTTRVEAPTGSEAKNADGFRRASNVIDAAVAFKRGLRAAKALAMEPKAETKETTEASSPKRRSRPQPSKARSSDNEDGSDFEYYASTDEEQDKECD